MRASLGTGKLRCCEEFSAQGQLGRIAARKKKEEEYLEMRRNELAAATEPVTPKILPGPIQPF